MSTGSKTGRKKDATSEVARTVRFPPELYERVRREAKAARRSVQEQILWLVERGVAKLPRD